MSIEQLLFFIVFTGIAVLLVTLNKKKRAKKPRHQTKEELINKYKKRVLAFNETQHSQEQKLALIKSIHKEVHNNIFFDDQETKKLIQKLSLL